MHMVKVKYAEVLQTAGQKRNLKEKTFSNKIIPF